MRFYMANATLSPGENRIEAVRPWVAVSGLAFFARESLLAAEVDSGDENGAEKRRNEVTDILAVRPLSSEYWLSLSERRLVTGEPPSSVVEALTLSALTGANEAYLMSRRGEFGLSHWEVLTPEVRKRAATELGVVELSNSGMARLRKILSTKTETVRQEIRTALQAEGFSPKGLANIGL